jgi:hypothetical protein
MQAMRKPSTNLWRAFEAMLFRMEPSQHRRVHWPVFKRLLMTLSALSPPDHPPCEQATDDQQQARRDGKRSGIEPESLPTDLYADLREPVTHLSFSPRPRRRTTVDAIVRC